MKNFRIGVIGGTGGMGQWFVRLLEEEGYAVHVRGKGTGMGIEKMAGTCVVIAVAVPIGVTVPVIREVGPLLKEDSLFMDLTSLKKEPVEAMLRFSGAEVVGCHPLFGPGVTSLNGQNVVLCPARGSRWLPWLRDLFRSRGGRVVETTPERHDRAMAVVQGLTHLTTVLMGEVFRESGLSREDLDLVSTPVFRTKLAMIEKVASSPRLYGEMLTMNPYMADVVSRCDDCWSRLKEVLGERDADALIERIGHLGDIPGAGRPKPGE